MGDWRRSLLLILVLGCLVLSGCTSHIPGAQELQSGDRFSTQSGLTFVVPSGATATVERPGAEALQSDVQFTELVDIQTNSGANVVLMSFSETPRNSLDATVVAVAGGVRVLDMGAASLRAVIETDVDGKAPGRIVVMVPAGRVVNGRGLEIARDIWDLLGLTGATLPQ